MSQKRILLIGGGTGTSTLLSALRSYDGHLSVIVSSADDGGSTGKLRTELGVFPPGDIRQCVLALAKTDHTDLYNYRFTDGSLKGHAFGNILIAALEKTTGSIEAAVVSASKLFDVQGDVITVTTFGTLLTATLENGEQVVGEHAIDDTDTVRTSPIASMKLEPSGPANPRAIEAIRNADAIILGPGDLYTSTLPNLLVDDIREAILASKAKKILVSNIMTKYGQTDNFAVSDFVREVETYLGGTLDAVVVNTKAPSNDDLARYADEHSTVVTHDADSLSEIPIQVIAESLISPVVFKAQSADALKRSALRHDGSKTAAAIWKLLS